MAEQKKVVDRRPTPKKKSDQRRAPKQIRSSGRSKAYYDSGRHELNKLKRILESSGPDAAVRWAQEHQCISALRQLREAKPSAYNDAVRRSPAFARAVGR